MLLNVFIPVWHNGLIFSDSQNDKYEQIWVTIKQQENPYLEAVDLVKKHTNMTQ